MRNYNYMPSLCLEQIALFNTLVKMTVKCEIHTFNVNHYQLHFNTKN